MYPRLRGEPKGFFPVSISRAVIFSIYGMMHIKNLLYTRIRLYTMLIALLLIQTMPPAINYEQYYPFNSNTFILMPIIARHVCEAENKSKSDAINDRTSFCLACPRAAPHMSLVVHSSLCFSEAPTKSPSKRALDCRCLHSKNECTQWLPAHPPPPFVRSQHCTSSMLSSSTSAAVCSEYTIIAGTISKQSVKWIIIGGS